MRQIGAGAVRFANSIAVRLLAKEQPFATKTTMLLEKGLLSQQPYGVVGEDCSLSTACACCWQRIFIFFRILNSNLFGSLATLFTSTWLNTGPFATFSYISLIIFVHLNFLA
jgi:hypothetical protein